MVQLKKKPRATKINGLEIIIRYVISTKHGTWNEDKLAS